jgi:UDP-N-acetylglucosamine acyltransferase
VRIHSTAVVSPLARIGQDVVIHPFCVVEAGAEIGDGCMLESRVVVKTGTRLGQNNRVFEGAVLGGLPQHVRMPPQVGELVIGDSNTIRENVTIHRALEAGHATVIGDHNLLMVGVHVAHDCQLGSHGIVANNTLLAGHVTVADRAYISGAVAVHQFCRIGALAMVGGQAHLVKDVPPFVTVDGKSTFVVGLNLVGLRRAGYTAPQIDQLKAAYRLIYRSGLPWSELLQRLAQEFPAGPAAQFHEFFSGGKRGFTPERRLPRTLRLPDEAVADTSEVERRAKAG